ncbi:NAD(P)/FAD-dependent oxidoreductase [Polaromonas sp.]|uniref:NAD(P)/FAD-dependent oxidoreductase n=1 Tax=Polaromonas sp. TaxID=1869339 RepID=UPI003568F699
MTSTSVIQTDAVVIGAGPVGLFQVFQLGLLEIKAHVVDSLPHLGGQCMELYPDKPIYDIPGTPRTSGRELVASLLKQIEPFGATFHLGQEVSTLAPQTDGRFLVETSRGKRFLTKTIFIAAGVGAFQPRRLKIDGLDAFEHTQLFHHVTDPTWFAGKNLLIVGGDEPAMAWAARFAEAGPHQAGRVTLLHRREVLTASADAQARFRGLCDAGALQFRVGQVTGIEVEGGTLRAARITDVNGDTAPLPIDALLVLLGLSPKLGPLAHWGLDMERKQLVVDTEKFSTSIPGIFAVGDINTYPGKKKLILCGFHECALAAFGAAALIFPGEKIQLQYTTTSPRLHKLLGVESPVFD